MHGRIGRVAGLVALVIVATIVGRGPSVAASDLGPSDPPSSVPAADGRPSPAEAAGLHTVTPKRLLDTRDAGTPLGPGATLDLVVTGRAGIPTEGVAAVVVNLTGTEPTRPTFLTAWPAGVPRPWASNLNLPAGGTRANLVVVGVGDGGRMALYNADGLVHVVVDVAGWVPGGGDVRPVVPCRLLDTRDAHGPVGPGATVEVEVLGRGGVPADGVVAVVANLTATGATATTFVTAWPSGSPRPWASNLNPTPGAVTPNLVVVPIGRDGRISLANAAGSVHLVLDVLAWVPTGAGLHPLSPTRLLDTRDGVGAVRTGASLDLQATGRGGVPADGVGAVLLNLTITSPEAAGYVTAHPTGEARPWASNVNMVAGQTVPNLVLAGVGTGGRVRLYASAGTHLVADVVGWLPGSTPPLPPVPTVGGCPIFSPAHPWNQDVSGFPVHPASATYVASIGASAHLHPDVGSNPTYGIPFVVVGEQQPALPITYTAYGDESDPGPFPVPLDAPIEGGPASDGDRHVLVVRQGECALYELYRAFPAGAAGWRADSGARWPLGSDALRPLGWTSADAAGLPILPGLLRYDEVAAGHIHHALRVTVRRTQRAFVLPATHWASSSTDPALPPMGLRLRLRADYDLTPFTGQARVILEALQRYGMLVADNGSSWFVTGAPDPRWDDDDLDQLKRVPGHAFEAVDTGPLVTRLP